MALSSLVFDLCGDTLMATHKRLDYVLETYKYMDSHADKFKSCLFENNLAMKLSIFMRLKRRKKSDIIL